jgi:hypothetical protein
MAGSTVGAHVDEGVIAKLKELGAIENRPNSQYVAVALKVLLELSPGARRSMFAIDGAASEAERAYAIKAIGRSVLLANNDIIDARNISRLPDGTNTALETEEEIEAEAVRLCRP